MGACLRDEGLVHAPVWKAEAGDFVVSSVASVLDI